MGSTRDSIVVSMFDYNTCMLMGYPRDSKVVSIVCYDHCICRY